MNQNTITMKASTTTILSVLKVITWVTFIVLCIKAGVLLLTVLLSLTFNPQVAKDLYMGLDLSRLMESSQWRYICLTSLLIFLSGIKAWFFYRITLLFTTLNLKEPFNAAIHTTLVKISRTALEVGVLALVAREFVRSLGKNGYELPSLHEFLGGGVEFLFMAGIIYIIAHVFRRGMEIQTENDLTI